MGVVFGNVSTTEFRFAVRDPSLKRLDYVQVHHPTDGALVAQVTEVTRETNLSFDAAVAAAATQTLSARPPAEGARDHLVARARVIGFRDARGLLQAPRTPVPAGADVRRVDTALLANVFGLRDTEGAYVGTVKGYDLRVMLDINTLVQKHVSILAKTGAGKSYAVGVLMEELIKQGVPIVVVDPHGEHHSLSEPNNSPQDQNARRRFGVTPRNYGEHIVEYSPDTQANPEAAPFALESVNLEARDIAGFLGAKLTNSQMGILHAAVRELRDTGKDYDLAMVLESVRESSSNAKWNLVSALEATVGLGVFSGKGTAVESLVQPEKVSILNLKGVAPDVQQIVVAMTSRRLFEARKLGKVPPFMLVVEEAHNFCPERGMSTTVTGDIMRTLASEGRKFGMGLMVVSQRPAKVDKNVLSQCNTQIILKVTNPNDLKALASSVEGFTADSVEEIQRLPVGVGFVSHPRISIPVLVEIRPRETAHGGESVDVMKAVRVSRGEEDEDIAPSAAKHDDEDDAEDTDVEASEDGDDDSPAAVASAPPTKRARATRAAAEAEAPAPAKPVPIVAPKPPSAAAQQHAAQPPPMSRALSADEPPLPAWAQDVHEQVRFVARSDVDALPREHLQMLEAQLSERAQHVSQRMHELGARGEWLLRDVNAQLMRIHELLEDAPPGTLDLARRMMQRKEGGAR